MPAASGAERRAGFVALVGRPNAGKSTLLNRVLGQKVSITSRVPQTTRSPVRGILNRQGDQVVFVDTPGIHKPRTLLGRRLNDSAVDAASGVDLTVLVIDAGAPVGTGDRFVADLVPPGSFCVVNKIDAVPKKAVLDQLTAAAALGDFAEVFPVSARTGRGVDALIAGIVEKMPAGAALYPPDIVADTPEGIWVAELVREQLLGRLREELPHSVACRVTEWEWPRIRCEIIVERESQKGIVIGRRGEVLKEVGTAVRAQLPPGAYLELFVRVEPEWQSRPKSLERLGF